MARKLSTTQGSTDQRIIALVQDNPTIKVPQIAERLGLELQDLAYRLPPLIEQEAWDRGGLNWRRRGQ